MTLKITRHDDALQFAVKAVPGSSRDRILGLHGDALRVAVAAPPERGKANARLCEVLAAALGLPARAVEVAQGTASQHKVVRVRGLDESALLRALGL